MPPTWIVSTGNFRRKFQRNWIQQRGWSKITQHLSLLFDTRYRRWRVSLKGGFQISKPIKRREICLGEEMRTNQLPFVVNWVQNWVRFFDASAYSIPLNSLIRLLITTTLKLIPISWVRTMKQLKRTWFHQIQSDWPPRLLSTIPDKCVLCGWDNCGIGHCNDCLHQGDGWSVAIIMNEHTSRVLMRALLRLRHQYTPSLVVVVSLWNEETCRTITVRS